jgi:putative ABC transport system substrate-binding protein
MSGMGRRQFVVGAGATSLGLVAGCGRLPWQAQSPARVYRIGILVDGGSDSAEQSPRLAPFLQRLRELGYMEGQNLTIEFRSAQFDYGRLPDLAADLVQLPVDVILATGTPSSLAAARATGSIPIVTIVGDPVRTGLAASYARPGGNVTGITVLNTALSTKRLELLKETVPSTARVAVLWNVETNSSVYEFRETETAAQALGVELISLEVRSVEEFETAFEVARRGRADALVVIGDTLTNGNPSPIAALAAMSKLPGMYGYRESVLAGGLMSYGPSNADNSRRGAYYVDRILNGAKPADLPVEQPMTFDFVVNMRTAQALGITFPNEILLQVTEVIDQ